MNILSLNLKVILCVSIFLITLNITKISAQTQFKEPSQVLQLSLDKQQSIQKELTTWIQSLYITYNSLIQSKDKLEKEKYIKYISENFYDKPFKTNKIDLFNDLGTIDSDAKFKDIGSDIYLSKLSTEFENTSSIKINGTVRFSDIYIQKLYLAPSLKFKVDSSYYIEATVKRSLDAKHSQGNIKNSMDIKYFILLERLGNKWGNFKIMVSYKGSPEIKSTENADKLFNQAMTYYGDSYKKSFSFMKQAAEQGHPLAQSTLGSMYNGGFGISTDNKQAEYWLRKAAEQGHPFAQFYLGLMCRRGETESKDSKESVHWLHKAAEQGHYLAQSGLGLMYKYGQEVSQDDELSAYWYHKAAVHGDKEAQYALGYMYKVGKGVPQDMDLWAYWIQKSADRDKNLAQYILGNIYFEGKVLPQDYKKAAYRYKMVAGILPQAQYKMGIMYQEGKGMLKDNEKAKYWYKRACSNGVSEACEKLKSIE